MSAAVSVECDCGFTGTYCSRAKADYALRRHSCARHLAKGESRRRGQARDAAVDRTPKRCLHKVANHRHGTNAAYILDRCRCRPCARAHAAQETWRVRQKAYGRYDRYVDAVSVRDHVRALMDQGMGLKRIVAVSGVSQGVLWKLMYGKRRPDGSQRPSRRVLRTTAERILATRVELAGGALVDDQRAETTTRKIRALVALGWSLSQLATRLDIKPTNFQLHHGDRHPTVATADKVDRLYDQLSMKPPPQSTPRERAAATRSRTYAKRRGWLPPLALDEDLTPPVDDAGHGPSIDEQAIWRRLNGDRGVRLTPEERVELLRRWEQSGRPLNECERITGINVHRHRREAA